MEATVRPLSFNYHLKRRKDEVKKTPKHPKIVIINALFECHEESRI